MSLAMPSVVLPLWGASGGVEDTSFDKICWIWGSTLNSQNQ